MYPGERKTSRGKVRLHAIEKTRYLQLFQALIWQGTYAHASFLEQIHHSHLQACSYAHDLSIFLD